MEIEKLFEQAKNDKNIKALTHLKDAAIHLQSYEVAANIRDEIKSLSKIAVLVQTDKEVNAICKFKGWSYPVTAWLGKCYCVIYLDEPFLQYNKLKEHNEQELQNYQVIEFQDFAKEHNIKLLLITSEDGVDLYEYSEIHIVWKDGHGWEYDGSHKGFRLSDGEWYVNPGIIESQRKIFSTRQAALEWIEAQKPKEIVISPDSGYPIIVYAKPMCGDEYIHLDMSKRGDYNGANIHLTITELKEAVKAYETLHG